MNARSLICTLLVTVFSSVGFAQVTPAVSPQSNEKEKSYFGIGYMLTNYGVMVLEVAEGSYGEGVLQPGALITKIGNLTTGNHISQKILVSNEQVKQALETNTVLIQYREANLRDPYNTTSTHQAILRRVPESQLKYKGENSLMKLGTGTRTRAEMESGGSLTTTEKGLLGLMTYLGLNGKQNVDTGVRLIREAAAADHSYSQVMLASIGPHSGNYVERKMARSKAFLKVYESSKNPTALRYYGWSLSSMKGNKGTGVTEEMAISWMEKSAIEAKGRNSAREVGKYYLKKGDPEKALPYMRFAAERGEPHAMFYLAERYFHGDGVPQNLESALILYENIKTGLYDHRGPKPSSRAYQCRKALGTLPPPAKPVGVACHFCGGDGRVSGTTYLRNYELTPTAYAFPVRCRTCNGKGRLMR